MTIRTVVFGTPLLRPHLSSHLPTPKSTKCQQKLVIYMYDREYAVQSTEFDIVEQGHVPILMSLPQMRNLRFQFRAPSGQGFD